MPGVTGLQQHLHRDIIITVQIFPPVGIGFNLLCGVKEENNRAAVVFAALHGIEEGFVDFGLLVKSDFNVFALKASLYALHKFRVAADMLNVFDIVGQVKNVFYAFVCRHDFALFV